MPKAKLTEKQSLMHIAQPAQFPELPAKGLGVWSRSGSLRGETTGGSYHCQLEGCSGLRIAVRWPGKKITYPCSKGLMIGKNGEMQIQ